MTEQTDKTSLWKTFSRPPEVACKEITAGRLKGYTDISPQWRILAMTKAFGVCGVGWKYAITKRDFVKCEKAETLCLVELDLFIKIDGEWSEPIPGSGGSHLTTQEKNGPYNDNDAVKKATTDALSVAMKLIGVAADVYLNNQDGSKYPDMSRPEPRPDPNKKEAQFLTDVFDTIRDDECPAGGHVSQAKVADFLWSARKAYPTGEASHVIKWAEHCRANLAKVSEGV